MAQDTTLIHASAHGILSRSSGQQQRHDSLEAALDAAPGPVRIAADGLLPRPLRPAPIKAADLGWSPLGAAMILDGVHMEEPRAILPNPAPILGLLAEEPKFDGVICLLSDCTRWVRISAEEICHALTDLTRQIVQPDLPGHFDDAAIRLGLSRTQGRNSRLGVHLAETAATAEVPNPASLRLGLAMGCEFDAAKAYWLGERVVFAGPEPLARAYCSALNEMGGTGTTADIDTLAFKGLAAAAS